MQFRKENEKRNKIHEISHLTTLKQLFWLLELWICPRIDKFCRFFLLWPYNTRGAMSKIHLIMIYKLIVTPFVDIVKMDALAWWKISKHHFIKDIENSFHEVTHIGLKPHQFFSFWNILTNTVARAVQSFGQNEPWLARSHLYIRGPLIATNF